MDFQSVKFRQTHVLLIDILCFFVTYIKMYFTYIKITMILLRLYHQIINWQYLYRTIYKLFNLLFVLKN